MHSRTRSSAGLVVMLMAGLLVGVAPPVSAANVPLTAGSGYAAFSSAVGTPDQALTGAGSWYKLEPSAAVLEMYIEPATMLGTSFTVDQIVGIRYSTLNDGTNPSGVDFFLKIYTEPTGTGDDATWYKHRLNAEPLYSNNYLPAANVWTQWSTAAGSNQLVFFDGNHTTNFGFYDGPTLGDLQAGAVDWSSYAGAGPGSDPVPIDYGPETVKYIVLGTGTGWPSFEGYMDAIEIELSSGDTYVIDLEGPVDTVYVDDDWVGLPPMLEPEAGKIIGHNAYATVQDGVDNVSGSTVNVAAGSYEEQIEIDMDLDLVGAGAGLTTILSPTFLPLFFTTSPNDNYPVIYAHDAAAVNVSALTVDGAGLGNGNYRFIGVAFRNAGGSLVDCEVINIQDTPFSGVQHGVGIYAYNNDDVARTLDVLGNTVTGFQKNAMALTGSATTPLVLDVSGNVCTGAGATDIIAQNGIQVSGALASGQVDNNTVTDVAYDNTLNPIKYVATSVLNYYANIDITNNQISGGHLGVYHIDAPGTLGGNTIDIEKIGVYAFGLIATDPPGVVASPFDGAPAAKVGGASKALLSVDVVGNVLTFTGPDNTATYGIEADAGWGPDDIAVTVTDNDVSGYEVGYEFYQCESGCNTGVFTSITANQNVIVGNTIGMRSNVPYLTVDGSCNWWGDISGPATTLNPGTGDPAVGDIVFWPWLDAAGGNCNQYGGDFVAANPTGLINACTPCVTVPIDLSRTDVSTARGISVTFQLSPELELCGSGIQAATGLGSFFDGFGNVQMQVLDNGGGSWTVDMALLGLPCGPTTGGTVFTLDVAKAAGVVADAVGTITMTSVLLRDCVNVPLPALPGPPANITIDLTAPGALTDLDASQLKAGNDSDGTTIVNLSWTNPTEPDATTVTIYRKGFGFYPEYDDLGGVAPAAPVDEATALGAGWTPVGTVAVGTTTFPDDPPARDFWFYVAFVSDGCEVSGVSNRTGGTLNYHLGDVAGGGNNLVATVDVSALGAAYGTSDGDGFYVAALDVGPTTDFFVNARPTTDDQIQFEDLLMFAINFGQVSKAPPGLSPAVVNAVALQVPTLPAVGETFEVPVTLRADGSLRGLSVPVRWDEQHLEYLGWSPGGLLGRQGGLAPVFSPRPGVIDAAVFGPRELGIAGEGELAVLRFRVRADGDPGLALDGIDARDFDNERASVDGNVVRGAPGATPALLATEMRPNRPNPFNPRTTVHFVVGHEGPVRVAVYTLSGRLVRTLIDESMARGEQSVIWDGTDDAGRSVASGTYAVRLTTIDAERVRNVVLLK